MFTRAVSTITRLRRVAGLESKKPWIFIDAEFLALTVELDRDRLQRILPFGLRSLDPATATLFVAHYPWTTFGSVYSEAGLFVDVRHPFGKAVHCPWMLVDDDIALIAGRELLGYPKKIGAIDVRFPEPIGSGDLVNARVERRGDEIFRIEACVGELEAQPPPMLGHRALNVTGTLGLSLQRLIAFAPREEIIEARTASAELKIGSASRDPLHELGIGRVRAARYYRVNIGGRSLPLPVFPVSPLYWMRNFTMRYQ